MKVVILAAGRGSRFGSKDHPKALTTLTIGKSIMEYQLEQIQRHISLDHVMIVVGYHKEDIMNAVPDVLYVYNPLFAEENTAKSLLRALSKCEEDVLWINGDVVFHPSVLEKILKTPRTSMVVNEGSVGEEEVKYRKDDNGKILVVSKTVDDPQGEALGINYCSASDLSHLRRGLEQCADMDYFERGIEFCIEEGMAVWSIPVDQSHCTEIDFPEDLVRANKMLLTW